MKSFVNFSLVAVLIPISVCAQSGANDAGGGKSQVVSREDGSAEQRWTIEGVYLGMPLAEAISALESVGYKRLAVSYSFQRRQPGSTKPDGFAVGEDGKGRVVAIRHAKRIPKPDWERKREELVRRFGQPDSCIGPGPARSTRFPIPAGATV
jgi:hypothetical protein